MKQMLQIHQLLTKNILGRELDGRIQGGNWKNCGFGNRKNYIKRLCNFSLTRFQYEEQHQRSFEIGAIQQLKTVNWDFGGRVQSCSFQEVRVGISSSIYTDSFFASFSQSRFQDRRRLEFSRKFWNELSASSQNYPLTPTRRNKPRRIEDFWLRISIQVKTTSTLAFLFYTIRISLHGTESMTLPHCYNAEKKHRIENLRKKSNPVVMEQHQFESRHWPPAKTFLGFSDSKHFHATNKFDFFQSNISP